jgi:predicted metal-binding membrane protein
MLRHRTPLGGRRDATLLVTSLLLLTGSAWLALWYLGDSPYLHLFHAHGAPVCISGQMSNSMFGLLFVCGWILMTIAMMLPTSIPVLVAFHSICRARANRPLLIALAVLGYLSIWLAFGFAAYAATVRIARAADNLTWIQSRPWMLTAGILALAGMYQFSPLKYRCLDKCRSPFSFIAGHWHGRKTHTEAFILGASHGAFCVGCCWALMLLMVPIGAGNLGWMLMLAVVMAVEKNLSVGKLMAKPLGAALVMLAVFVLLQGSIANTPARF